MKIMAVVLLAALLLGGCSILPAPPASQPPPVVTRVTVTVLTAQSPEVMVFDQDRQTTAVLNYLRTLDFRQDAQVNPQYAAGPMYEFLLEFSDGSSTRLLQKDQRYFMSADGVWRQIAPYSGSRLPRILGRQTQENPAPSYDDAGLGVIPQRPPQAAGRRCGARG